MAKKQSNIVKQTLDLSHMPQPSAEQKARMDAIAGMPEDHIDYTDAPHLPDAVWLKAAAALPSNKKQITLRIDADVLACMQRGVDVLQLNLDEGLRVFADQSFDVVLQIDTFQHLRNAQTMLLETVRVGRAGIIAFPNFAHWRNRLSILRGRMPVNARLPYEWYDTPNIRVGTFADFGVLAARNGLRVLDQFGLAESGQVVRTLPNLLANTAVYRVAK